MATAQEHDGPVCPICVESFTELTEPKVLSCGHSYCLACLKSYVGEDDDTQYFQCPVCRKRIEVPGDGIEAFPTNYSLVKSARVVTIASKCRNHAQRDAECYCRKCESLMCYKCLHLYHKDHDSFDLESEVVQVAIAEEFSTREKNILGYIDKLKTVSKTLSSAITTFSHEECKKVDDYTEQLMADIKQKAERAKTYIRHKCGEKLTEVEVQEDVIRDKAENAEVELVEILSCTSKESFLSRVQNLPRLKQLDTKLKEVEIRLPKVDVLEWTPGRIEVPDNLGTVQIKPLLLPTSLGSLLVKTDDLGDGLGDDAEEPGVQFSFIFSFDPEAWGYEDAYYSEDTFVTALRKLIWRCFLTFKNGMFGVYVVLIKLKDENEDIDHCVIDYRLSIYRPDCEEAVVVIQERDSRIDPNVSHGYSGKDLSEFITFEYPLQIKFDIIRVKEIVNV